jgi:hypothetical protein
MTLMPLALHPVTAGLFVLVASAGGVPTIDVKKTCQTSQQALTAIFGDQVANMYDSCLKQEEDARAQLQKDWAALPAADRALCAQPTGYMPSYVEWLTCVEMQREVRKIRTNEQADTKGRSP